MKTYSGLVTKEMFVAEMVKHQEADNFIRGKYWTGSKGCAVGCGLKSLQALGSEITDFSQHSKMEEYLGIPEWLARVEDSLFEGMSLVRAKTWPVDFAKAVPIGVDLDPVKPKFIVMLLRHTLKSMDAVRYDAEKWPQVAAAIAQSKAAVQQMIEARELEISAASSAACSAAYSAARSAADSASSACSAADSAASSACSAACSAARSAARSAADSAASSACSAARSAADSAASSACSAACSAAYSAAYDYYADQLLDLLQECK